MGLRVVYVFTHDSIGLGEDGPTHQPVEQLASLRTIPNLTVIRPCDANETAEAWRVAISSENGPVALALTRQGMPVLDRNIFGPAAGLAKGAYVLKDVRDKKPDIILIGTGSEVQIALDASQELESKGVEVRVVSMPSWELFDKQSEEYKDEVLPPETTARISIEAGVAQGWHQYVGDRGEIISMNRFGASAPSKILYEKFGFTPERVVEKALAMLGRD